MIVKSAVSRGLLPVLIVGAVLGASFLMRPVSLNSRNTVALCSVGYGGAPTVTSISPTSGPIAGGTTVAITGCGFTGVTSVHFGATVGTGLLFNSDTSVTVHSPAHAEGIVDVTVTTPLGPSATTAADQFDFLGVTCLTAGLTSDKPSPQQIGTTITFTATSTGCTSPQYLFYLQSPGGAWTLVRGYDGPVWVWDTTTEASIGNYVVDVWVTNAGSGVAVQANHTLPFTLTTAVCNLGSGAFNSSLPSPQQIDFPITFTVSAPPGCAHPEYLFYLKSPDGTWELMQGPGPAMSWTWNTSTEESIGNYLINVWVRAAGSGVPFQDFNSIAFTLTNRVCTAAGLGVNKASPQVHGAVITFTGSSASCARPEYLFYLKGPGTNGTWSVVRGYDGTTWVWNTAGVASVGTYEVNVWVRAIGSGVAVQTNATMNYTLT